MPLMVSEVYVNATTDTRFGDSGIYECFTDSLGELFRRMQKEYGRCVSKVYIDSIKGTKSVGWVFQKMMQYEDSKKTYIREVWVSYEH